MLDEEEALIEKQLNDINEDQEPDREFLNIDTDDEKNEKTG